MLARRDAARAGGAGAGVHWAHAGMGGRDENSALLRPPDGAARAWGQVPECPEHVQAWVAEMAEFVKRVDPHHLVTVGEEGFFGPKRVLPNEGRTLYTRCRETRAIGKKK